MKAKILEACQVYVQERITTARQAIASASAAASDDTKSSAGDKFETTREMMQQEISRHQQLLTDALKMELVLNQLDIQGSSSHVRPGSLVKTNRGNFFIAVSAGQLQVDGQVCYAVSAASPIGQLLLGKTVDDRLAFNGLEYQIRSIH